MSRPLDADNALQSLRVEMESRSLHPERKHFQGQSLGINFNYADWMHLAGNTFANNRSNAVKLEGNTTNIVQSAADITIKHGPKALFTASRIMTVGETARFDASMSTDPTNRPLQFRWKLADDTIQEQPRFAYRTTKPGFIISASSSGMGCAQILVPSTSTW